MWVTASTPVCTAQACPLSITDVHASDLMTAFFLPAGITPALFDPVTGVLVLEGAATLADHQVALRRVAFNTTAEATGGSTRTTEINVNDGVANSNVALSQINISPAPQGVVQNTPAD